MQMSDLTGFFKLLAVSAFAEAASEADFYIAVNGNDAWTGQLAAPNAAGTDGPFASIQAARNEIRKMKTTSNLNKPVTVLLRGGTYQMLEPVEFLPIDSGSKNAPITYAAYPGEKPVISGGITITGWKEGKDGIWTADVPLARGGKWRFRQLWINGKRCIPARTPDYGKAFWSNGPIKPKGEERDDRFFDYSYITYSEADSEIWESLSDSKDKGIFVAFHNFTSSFHQINSIDKERKAVFSLNPCNKGGLQARRYYVAYNRESLDAPGEWYLDTETGIVSYYPREGEDMSEADVIAPFGRNLLRLKGDTAAGKWVEYLRFEGLSFQYTDWVMDDTAIVDGHSAVAYDHTAAVHMAGAKHCEVTDCEIAHTGNWGLRFGEGSRMNKAERCHLYDLGASGVMIGDMELSEHRDQQTEKNVVHNCFIHHGGRVFHAGVGVWVARSSYNTVSHNEICDLYWTGVMVGWMGEYRPSLTHHNLIEYNHIHHLAWDVLNDLGGIYTSGKSPGTVIQNNVIHHISSVVRRGRGIYTDQASTDILVKNNLVYLVNDGAFHVNWGKNNTVRNNIFVLADEYGVITGGGSREGGGKDIPYIFEQNIVCTRPSVPAKNVEKEVRSNMNLYWQQEDPEGLGKWLAGEKRRQQEVDSIVADPQFVDPDKHDFRIADTSPAIAEIGFDPFDPGEAGLIGDAEWTSLPGKIKRAVMKFWSQRSLEVNACSETDRWRAGFTP